jgi:hypothetical protein
LIGLHGGMRNPMQRSDRVSLMMWQMMLLTWNAPELVDGLGLDNMSHPMDIHHDSRYIIHASLKIIIQYFENMCSISYV